MKCPFMRWWFWVLLPVSVSALGLLTFCWIHRVWSVGAWQVYQAMEHECHPVWRDYHFGRIHPADPVEEVVAQTQPARVEQKGRWMILNYQSQPFCFTGVTALAYDGQMVCAFAWSCTWVRLFFDEMTETNVEQPITLLLAGGSPSVLPANAELAAPLGEMLKAVLLKARASGMFQNLPKAPGCQLSVEHFDGAYGWPEYEARGAHNLA